MGSEIIPLVKSNENNYPAEQIIPWWDLVVKVSTVTNFSPPEERIDHTDVIFRTIFSGCYARASNFA